MGIPLLRGADLPMPEPRRDVGDPLALGQQQRSVAVAQALADVALDAGSLDGSAEHQIERTVLDVTAISLDRQVPAAEHDLRALRE